MNLSRLLVEALKFPSTQQGYRHSKIDGDTAASTRFEIAQHFNNDASVFGEHTAFLSFPF